MHCVYLEVLTCGIILLEFSNQNERFQKPWVVNTRTGLLVALQLLLLACQVGSAGSVKPGSAGSVPDDTSGLVRGSERGREDGSHNSWRRQHPALLLQQEGVRGAGRRVPAARDRPTGIWSLAGTEPEPERLTNLPVLLPSTRWRRCVRACRGSCRCRCCRC